MISAHRKPSDGAVLATSPSICFLALGPSPQCVVKTIKLTSRFVTDLLGTAIQRWACVDHEVRKNKKFQPKLPHLIQLFSFITRKVPYTAAYLKDILRIYEGYIKDLLRIS